MLAATANEHLRTFNSHLEGWANDLLSADVTIQKSGFPSGSAGTGSLNWFLESLSADTHGSSYNASTTKTGGDSELPVWEGSGVGAVQQKGTPRMFKAYRQNQAHLQSRSPDSNA